MADETPSSGSSRRLRGLNPAALMAQGMRSSEVAVDQDRLPEIPGYELLARLGEGGMGEVFLARQLSLDREVAVKLVRRELLTEEWFLERLESEARLLARLRNPHLVTVHDFLRLPDGTAAVVMERVAGGSLRDRLCAEPTGLPLDAIAQWGREIASALAAAHAAGIVHRDVKPENVLLDNDGRAYVSDFGMARTLASAAPRLTGTGSVAGTPGYLAPEQLTGAATDHRSDIFSFGVLFYEMLTGRLPLGSFDPPQHFRPEIPGVWVELVLRSLRPDPAERPPNFEAWLKVLETPLGSPTPSPPVSAPRRISRRAAVVGGCAAALAAGGVRYALWLRQRNRRPETAEGAAVSWQTLAWPDDLKAATLAGGWRRDGGSILSDDTICLIGVARTLPTAYDLRLTLSRLGGSESIGLFFRHPAGYGSCELDGWSRHRSGVQAISGRTTQEAAGFDQVVHAGEDLELGFELRPDEVRIRVGGELRQTCRLEGESLTLVAPWLWNPGPTAPALAVGSYQSPTRFLRLLWRDRTHG